MIAISFALPEESKGLVPRLSNPKRSGPPALPVISGALLGHDVVILHTGIGMDSAAAQVTAFLHTAQAPILWIAAGFGGALAENLKIGDIVRAENFSLPGLPCPSARSGILITTKSVVQTATEKRDLARHTGAVVVDMETAAIQRLCAARSIPLLAIRSISDLASQDLPLPSSAWFNPKTQRPRPLRLLFHLATHPARILPFICFVRDINRARASLTQFLMDVFRLFREICAFISHPAS